MAHRRAEKGSSEDGFCRLNVSFPKEKGWKRSSGKGTACAKSERHRGSCTGSPKLVVMPSLSWRAGHTHNLGRPDSSRHICCSRLSRQVTAQSTLCYCHVKAPEGAQGWVGLPKAARFKSRSVPRIALLSLARASTAGLLRSWRRRAERTRGQPGLQPGGHHPGSAPPVF